MLKINNIFKRLCIFIKKGRNFFTELEYYNNSVKKNKLQLSDLKKKLPGFLKRNYQFKVGDILEISFLRKTAPFLFKGICLGIKYKKLKNPNTSIILRNVILGIGVEIKCNLYYNRIYRMKVLNYRKKNVSFSTSKIYFLRNRANNETRVSY